MLFDHTSIGGGVVGFNSTYEIINNIIKLHNNKNIKNYYNFVIIDKKIRNLEGGIAYSPDLSAFGYFNNPIRLSPKSFINFVKNNKFFKYELIKSLNIHKGYVDKDWLKKNFDKIKNPKSNIFQELYLPRLSYGIWQKYRLIQLLDLIYKFNKKNNDSNISLSFIEGEVDEITEREDKTISIKFNEFGNIFKINKSKNNINYVNTKNKILSLNTIHSTISIGLNPPKDYLKKKNNNYIWDFYKEGSTKKLLEIIKIQKINKFNKTIKLCFIGFKAGLLESLPEINQRIKNKKININISVFSTSLKTMQKAELTVKKYNFFYINNSLIKNVKKAKDIITIVKKEFNFSKKNNLTKYDAWTAILKNKILEKLIKNLNSKEKLLYQEKYFSILRNMTRFTYAYPIEIKDELIDKKILKLINEKVHIINTHNKKLIVKTKNNKNYIFDIVVNVSGPLTLNKIHNESNIINSLKKLDLNYSSLGFKVNKYYSVTSKNNIFVPGVLAENFNPNRITILDAILNNSNISSLKIYNLIKSKNNVDLKIKHYINKHKNNNNTYITKGGVSASKFFFDKKINLMLNKATNKKSNKIRIIIDGKAGSGKSTVGKILAYLFDSILIDTGYIFKALSNKLLLMGYNKNNLEKINNSQIKKIILEINIQDISNNNLNTKKIREMTSFISHNNKIRLLINNKIKSISSIFDTFIITGRDTGFSVYNNDKEIQKFFLNINDKIAASRKLLDYENSRTSENYYEIMNRNINDKKNIKIANNAHFINNNSSIDILLKKFLKIILHVK